MADKWEKITTWDEAYAEMDCISAEARDEIDLKVKIVDKIIEVRKDKGITQAELEAISGLKQTYIARLENNRNDPQLTTILKLLRPLGMTLDIVPIGKN